MRIAVESIAKSGLNTSLVSANLAQTGSIGNSTTQRNAMLEAVVLAMNMMYSVLGQCITQFNTDATQAAVIFDLEAVRSRLQTSFESGVKKGAFKNIVKRTLALTDTIDINVDGLSNLGFYLAKNSGDSPLGYAIISVFTNETKAIL